MDLEYEGGFSMKILIKTSMSLPGTSLELPASAVINVNKLTGRVIVFCLKMDDKKLLTFLKKGKVTCFTTSM